MSLIPIICSNRAWHVSFTGWTRLKCQDILKIDNPINIPKIVIEYLTYKCKSYGSVLIILPTKLDDKQKKFIYNDGLNSYNIF